MAAGFPQRQAVKVGYLVGANNHGVRESPGNCVGLGQGQALGQRAGCFTGKRRFIHIRGGYLKRYLQALQQFAAIT